MDIRTNHPVIEKETAIRNMGGLVWLYEKHLMKFQAAYADSAHVIRRHLLHNELSDAQILVHSIKGLSGTLGLRRLYYAASALELSIKNTDESIYDFLDIYERSLYEVLSCSITD